jgi:tetratricopeptide (TPR) repeat protein
MKRAVIIMVALGLSATATTLLGAADVPRTDKAQAARAEEVKGDLARAHSKYYEAVVYYRNAIKAGGPSSNVLNKMGVAEMQIAERGSARKHFSQAVKLDSRNVAALNNLGVLSCIERKYNPAVRYLKQALALQETNASAHLNIAEAWFGLGEIDRAMTEYTRALELDADILTSSPEAVVAHVSTPEQRARVDFTIAKAYMKRGNIEGALEFLRRAKEAHYSDLAKVYNDQAFAPLWDDPRLGKIIKR